MYYLLPKLQVSQTFSNNGYWFKTICGRRKNYTYVVSFFGFVYITEEMTAPIDRDRVVRVPIISTTPCCFVLER